VTVREAMWRRVDGGIEHVRVSASGEGVSVDGVVVSRGEGEVRRTRYRLQCDLSWRAREVHIDAPEDGASLLLRSDGEGRWRDGSDARLPALEGCVDVDLYAVVFTNTLPVRRLGLGVGETRTLQVAFVQLPAMTVQPVLQRYTRVADRLYRYEGLESGFVAPLGVDAGGLVVDYPGLARRMWSSP
jgi:hypothetical protein